MKHSPTPRPSFVLLVSLLAALFWTAPLLHAFPVITSVVETGGDNEATDTVPAKWTGVTYVGGLADEPVPGLLAGASYTVGTFRSYAPCYVDRNHRYTNAAGIAMPPYLVGQEYIMVGNDNRDNTGLRLDVTVATAVRVYLLIDNRLSDTSNANPPTFDATHMQWVVDDGWAPVLTGVNRGANLALPDEAAIDESADGTINQFFSIYSKAFPAGTFQLKQADNTGNDMYGVVVVSVAPPNAPLNLMAASADAKVTLTWTAGGGAAAYVVKRSDAPGGPYTLLATTASTSYMDTTVLNGSTYYYVVTGTNTAGESANSNEAVGAPNASPTGLAAVGGTNQVTVSWDAFGGASSYTVKRSSTSGGPYTTVASGIAGTSHVDTTVSSGRNYYYVVVAQLTGGGDSGQSNEAAGLTAPGAPALSTTLFASTVIRVGWTTDPVVAQVLLEQSTDGMNFTPLATASSNQGYTNSGLALNSTYFYRAQAQNGSGFSGYSTIASMTTPISGLNVNFAINTAPTPPGYFQDTGGLYGDRGNGYSYGWDRDITADGRQRNAANSPDLRYDTFMHMNKALPPAIWEIAIPNGYYTVRIVAGDAANSDSVFQFEVESVVTPTVTPGGVGSFNFNWADITTSAGVSDGRLTIKSGPNSQTVANNNKIAFIDIYPAIQAPPVIGTQPQSLMVEEYHAATFSVSLSAGNPPFFYQWYFNDVPLPGATTATYTVAHATNLVHTGSYTVIITNFGGSVTSNPALLAVTADNTAPALLSAGSLDGQTIGLCFSDELDNSGDAVNDAASYTVTTMDGVQPVIGVDIRPGGREIRLHLFLPSSGLFTVAVGGVTDLAGHPLSVSTATNTFAGFTVGDVGSPMLAGSHFTCDGNSIEIIGGGADVWGASDQAYLATRPTTGDFDARVRVTSVTGSDPITKAVLVARETTNPDSAGFHISVNPLPPGRDQIQLGLRTNTASFSGPWVAAGNNFTPANVPNDWLRITRLGNVFTGYRSTNGTNWIPMGTNTQPYAATLQVGIGLTAHNNSLLATSTFSGLQITHLTGAEPVNGTYNAGMFSASFPTQNGFTYTAEYKNTVNPGPWTTLATFVGDGTVQTFTDPGPVSPTEHRIYRVRYQ